MDENTQGLKMFFKKQKKAPILASLSEEMVEEKDIVESKLKHYPFKRVALVVGHSEENTGAATYRLPNGSKNTEFEWNLERANEIKRLVDLYSVGISTRVFVNNYKTAKDFYKKIGEWSPDCVIEFHFNALSEYKPAKGTEVLLIKKDAPEITKATTLSNAISKHLSTSKRHENGVKFLSEGERCHRELFLMRKFCKKSKLCCMLSPEFAHYPTDSARKLLEADGPKNYSRVVTSFLLGKQARYE